MREKIETELVEEDGAWWVYAIVDGERSGFGLGSGYKERAERDRKRIEEGDLYDVIINTEWYKEMKEKSKMKKVPEK